jgi:hypothetical protein
MEARAFVTSSGVREIPDATLQRIRVQPQGSMSKMMPEIFMPPPDPFLGLTTSTSATCFGATGSGRQTKEKISVNQTSTMNDVVLERRWVSKAALKCRPLQLVPKGQVTNSGVTYSRRTISRDMTKKKIGVNKGGTYGK